MSTPQKHAMIMDVTEREYQAWFESNLEFYSRLFIAFERYNRDHYFPENVSFERSRTGRNPTGYLNLYHPWHISLTPDFWEKYLEEINPDAAFNFHMVRIQLRKAGRDAMLERAGWG